MLETEKTVNIFSKSTKMLILVTLKFCIENCIAVLNIESIRGCNLTSKILTEKGENNNVIKTHTHTGN